MEEYGHVPILPSRELLSQFIDELYEESNGNCSTVMSVITKLLEGEVNEALRNLARTSSTKGKEPDYITNVLLLNAFRDVAKLYEDLLERNRDGRLDEETKKELVNVLETILAIIRLSGSPLLEKRLAEILLKKYQGETLRA